MKTLTKNLAKRSLSVLLVLMMVFSLLTVGITSVSAAEVEIAETGADFYYQLIGSMNSWKEADNNYKFTKNSDGDYVLDGVQLSGSITFKVWRSDNDRYIGLPSGKSVTTSNSIYNVPMGKHVDAGDYGGDIIINFTNGTYKFTYNDSEYTMTIEKSSGSSGGNTGGETGGTVPDTIYLNTAFWDATGFIEKYSAEFTVGSSNTTVQMTYVGANLYSFAVPENATQVTFKRLDGEAENTVWNSSATMTIPTNGNNLFTVNGWNGYGSETIGWSVYSASAGLAEFWVDTNANIEYAEDAIDILTPYKKGDTYYLYLPSGVDASKLKFYTTESNITVKGQTISETGTEINVTADGSTVHTLTGADVSKLVVFQSTASALYTKTDEAMPVEPGYDTNKVDGIHKDDYETENVKTENADGTVTNSQFYAMANPDGTLVADKKTNTIPVLKKVKGRGNSSWSASQQLFGKYAFNITLGDSSDLVGDDGTMSKKYCLVSYNADEARMRNMLIYGLSQEIGLNFTADYKPVDLYNNNRYIGSYLLTDKVEIGNPLVDIVNLDEINEGLYGDDYGRDDLRACISTCTLEETTAVGFDKYYDYSTLGKGVVPESVYAESGFLLEFENYDRFAAEMAGFISWQGQQIVCKYPEYPSKEQLQYIEGKWNYIEGILYGSSGTGLDYATLSNYIDVESFAKMYLIQELTKNVDAGATSYYVYYHDGKFTAGCSWDFDWALGQYAKERTLVIGNTQFPKTTNSTLLSKPDGWWASIKGIYGGLNSIRDNKYNFQAKLCQNTAFWQVVKAEWNENFKPIIDGYVANSANTATPANLSGKKIYELYNQVHASTLMDESRWGFIAADKMGTSGEEDSWGSKDTGDTHDAAVVWLNDFIYDRVTWMDTNGLDSENYTIQPPVLSLATDMPEGGFEVGTEVVINIDDKTGGSYTYTIYKNGVVVGTTEDKFFTVTAASTEDDYTVKATSKTSGKVSEESEELTVKGSGYAINPSLNVSSSSVLIGDTVTLTPSIEENYTGVDYKIYYKVDGGEAQLLSGNTYTQDVAGVVEFYVVASVTVDNEPVTGTTEAKPVKVTFSAFSVNVTASSNGSVMQGQNVTITATPSVEGNVTYTFYKDNEVIEGYENVTTNTYTEKMDDAGSFVYKVVAKYGEKIAENTVTVTVTEFDGTFIVKVLFKSSTVYAYKPNMTINGSAVELVEDTAIEVNKVGNGISTYRWYSYTFAEEQTYGKEITVNVSGNRDYFYNASYTFEVGNTDYACDLTGGVSSYYLALDNLNDRSIKNLSNISDMDGYQRAWTESAVHMIYNAKLDGELITPVGFSFRFADYGDANCDGKINIKDATYVQKSLANIVVADSLSTTVSDYNHDGKVTIKDATAIQKQIAGL